MDVNINFCITWWWVLYAVIYILLIFFTTFVANLATLFKNEKICWIYGAIWPISLPVFIIKISITLIYDFIRNLINK